MQIYANFLIKFERNSLVISRIVKLPPYNFPLMTFNCPQNSSHHRRRLWLTFPLPRWIVWAEAVENQIEWNHESTFDHFIVVGFALAVITVRKGEHLCISKDLNGYRKLLISSKFTFVVLSTLYSTSWLIRCFAEISDESKVNQMKSQCHKASTHLLADGLGNKTGSMWGTTPPCEIITCFSNSWSSSSWRTAL